MRSGYHHQSSGRDGREMQLEGREGDNNNRVNLFPSSAHTVPKTRFCQKIFLEQNLPQNYKSHDLKIAQNVSFEFLIFGIFLQFFPVIFDLSGNTV